MHASLESTSLGEKNEEPDQTWNYSEQNGEFHPSTTITNPKKLKKNLGDSLDCIIEKEKKEKKG
jgi:hypothetical protein